jgi:adenylate cyclase class 2
MIQTEVEIKLPVADRAAIQERLIRLGARLVHPREFEDNQLYDFADRSLMRRGALLRLRLRERGAILTYKEKGRVVDGAKVREEIEIPIEDGSAFVTLGGKLGLTPLFRYQKYRTTYHHRDVEITLDETPIGSYLEIEGVREGIDEVAGALGYDRSAYISASYRELFEKTMAREGRPANDMLFEES